MTNTSLDELIKQADERLHELEAEARESVPAAPAAEDIGTMQAAMFNRSPSGRTGKNDWMNCVVVATFLVLGACFAVWLIRPKPDGPYQVMTGTIRSSAALRSGRSMSIVGVTDEVALPDGRLVTVLAGPLAVQAPRRVSAGAAF